MQAIIPVIYNPQSIDQCMAFVLVKFICALSEKNLVFLEMQTDPYQVAPLYLDLHCLLRLI